MAGPYPPPLPYPPGYPGSLPPPVPYPATPRRGRVLWWVLGALVAVGALLAAVVVLGGPRPAGGTAAFTDASAKAAIQSYLTALSDGDTETVARNNACGMFDAIDNPRSDLSLARLASDAFRKQFSQAEVASIDKIVLSSSYQAQVLFTMSVAPTSNSRTAKAQEQGVAQLLRQDDKLLVCSYLLRTSGQY